MSMTGVCMMCRLWLLRESAFRFFFFVVMNLSEETWSCFLFPAYQMSLCCSWSLCKLSVAYILNSNKQKQSFFLNIPLCFNIFVNMKADNCTTGGRAVVLLYCCFSGTQKTLYDVIFTLQEWVCETLCQNTLVWCCLFQKKTQTDTQRERQDLFKWSHNVAFQSIFP